MRPTKTRVDIDDFAKHLEQFRYIERTESETKRVLSSIEAHRLSQNPDKGFLC